MERNQQNAGKTIEQQEIAQREAFVAALSIHPDIDGMQSGGKPTTSEGEVTLLSTSHAGPCSGDEEPCVFLDDAVPQRDTTPKSESRLGKRQREGGITDGTNVGTPRKHYKLTVIDLDELLRGIVVPPQPQGGHVSRHPVSDGS